jgi:hypothetical protein
MLRYTLHAEQRLLERGITKAEVESVVALREITYPDGSGKLSVVSTIGGRRIRVVLGDNDHQKVITVIESDN